MCIFHKPVKDVSKTKILTAALKNNRQLVVYTNAVMLASEDPNAMILPTPLAEGEQIVPLDISKYKGDLFEQCDNCFKLAVKSRSRGAARSSAVTNSLAVLDIGSYKVSLASNLADLRRIDESVFQVAPNVDQILGKHYAEGFGFVICQFQASMDPHPIAYTSSRLSDGRIFVPTRHEHGDGEEDQAHFDHSMYVVNSSDTEWAGTPQGPVLATPDKAIDWRALLKGCKDKLLFGKATSIRRHLIHGNKPNTDYYAAVTVDA